MKYNELQVTSNKDKKRVGRGIGSGHGKTAGRGTKGQSSRTGSKFGATFMGGQGPLVQRIPKKRGFRSLRAKAQTVYTEDLNAVKDKTITNMSLYEAGLIATPYHTVKLIVRGEYTGKATIELQAASAGAREQVEKAGGTFTAVDTPILPSSNPDRAAKRADRAAKADKKDEK